MTEPGPGGGGERSGQTSGATAMRKAEPLVWLVTGDDPALVEQAVTKLITSLAGDEDPALVLEEHGPDEDGVGSILDACTTPPFLAPRRIVLVRDAGRFRADDVNRLVAYLEQPLPSTALVLVAGGGALSAKLSSAVKRAGRVVDTRVASGRSRASFLADQVRRGPVRLDQEAIALLDHHLGEDLGRLAGILDILAATYGEEARLGPAEVEPLLGQLGAVPPWELTDAIDRGQIEPAVVALHRMLEGGQRHPLTIMAVLHRHYADMLRLDGSGVTRDEEAAQLLGTRSTWRAGKVADQARRLGSSGLTQAFTLLAGADLDLRGASGLPGEVVLEVLVARLCSRLGPRTERQGRQRRGSAERRRGAGAGGGRRPAPGGNSRNSG